MASSQTPPQQPDEQLPEGTAAEYGTCSRCHKRMPIAGLTRSPFENGETRVMQSCNECAWKLYNGRAEGKYGEDKTPKSDSKREVLTKEGFFLRYGGEVIEGTLQRKKKGDGDDDGSGGFDGGGDEDVSVGK